MRIAMLLLILLPAVPARADESGVDTSRAGAKRLALPKGDDVFHFIVYGDRTGGRPSGIQVLEKAVRETNLLDPDLVMTVGDLVQGYNQRGPWMAQMREYRGVMNKLNMPWYPVAGNHDIYWRGSKPPPGHHEADYEKHFGPLWYSFRHKNAAFVVLFSDEGDPASNIKGWRGPKVNQMSAAQLGWLKNTLVETKDADHVFVFLHHPKWRKDYYEGSNWHEAHALLKTAGNVSAVFAGHMHRRRYHGARDGIEYYTLAAVGGGMPFSVPGTGHLHHMDVVTVRKGSFKVATIPVGSVLDPKEMTPERLKEIDAVRRLPLPILEAPIRISYQGEVGGTITLRVKNPVTRPLDVTARFERGDRGWWLRPDHRHARLAPGATEDLVFRVERAAEDGLASLRVPRFVVETDYLARTMRVEMPERRRRIPLRLRDVPAGFHVADSNQALRLDGKRDCLFVPSAWIPVPDGPLTLEGRIRADTYEGRRGFLCKTEISGYGLFVSDGKPTFHVFLGENYVSALGKRGQLKPGRWYHIAGVFDGKQLRLYVDGKLIAETEAEGKRRMTDFPLFIGADPDRRGRAVSHIPGLIDEVRLSKSARYAGASFEPTLRHEPDGDTVLLLHLDRGIGPFAPDHSQGARHALQEGSVTYAPLTEETASR